MLLVGNIDIFDDLDINLGLDGNYIESLKIKTGIRSSMISNLLNFNWDLINFNINDA